MCIDAAGVITRPMSCSDVMISITLANAHSVKYKSHHRNIHAGPVLFLAIHEISRMPVWPKQLVAVIVPSFCKIKGRPGFISVLTSSTGKE
jgi:hypothetical protein